MQWFMQSRCHTKMRARARTHPPPPHTHTRTSARTRTHARTHTHPPPPPLLPTPPHHHPHTHPNLNYKLLFLHRPGTAIRLRQLALFSTSERFISFQILSDIYECISLRHTWIVRRSWRGVSQSRRTISKIRSRCHGYLEVKFYPSVMPTDRNQTTISFSFFLFF